MSLPTYFEIGINIPGLAGTFDYHVPANLEGKIHSGCLVVVPFGRQRVQGVVLQQVETPAVPETKPIESLLDPAPVLNSAQLELAQKMSADTLTPLAACLELMLPPGLSQQADSLYTLLEPVQPLNIPLKPPQQKIVALLEERGALRGRQIATAFPRKNWQAPLQALVRAGLVASQTVLPEPDVHIKMTRQVSLGVDPGKLGLLSNEIGRPDTAAWKRRMAALQFMANEGRPVDVSWVYAASQATSADLRILAEKGLVEFRESETLRDPLEGVQVVPDQPPQLSVDQMAAWQAVLESMDGLGSNQPDLPVLLHGVTGSGKTEIYLRAVAETIARGRQAIIMVPEISLTPQTVRRFMARFPGKVGLFHSRLSPGERYDTWRQARAGYLDVIVGPRSALFAPLPKLGLIVLDECHDPSYYQAEPAPAYNALQAARQYGRITGSLLLLGSATPDVTLMYQALKQHWRVLTLANRVAGHEKISAAVKGILPLNGGPEYIPLPAVEVVDMRQELKAGNHSMFSRTLQDAIRGAVDQKQQVILYLNRLGTSTYVFCRSCGYTIRCPRCERPLTYHAESKVLVCHNCNYRRAMPVICPQCKSNQIRQYGAGTERVEQELLKLIPEARTMRWDSEVTRQKGAHDAILTRFSKHQADVLIGTQMLAKGLDFPLVTVVGVVLADVGISLGDFRAGERTFQLLMQVAGRAGRSKLGGKVVMQTFQPEHYAIQAAADHNYQAFYQRELGERRSQNYPPFSRLVRLELRMASLPDVEANARRMAARLQTWMEESDAKATRLIGPAPCYFPKQAGQYRWQIVLAGPDPTRIIRGKELGDWRIEVDPQSLL